MKRRLERYIELDCLIPESQYGFRKSKSCEECVAILNLEIYNSFIRGEQVEAILLLSLPMTMFILRYYLVC